MFLLLPGRRSDILYGERTVMDLHRFVLYTKQGGIFVPKYAIEIHEDRSFFIVIFLTISHTIFQMHRYINVSLLSVIIYFYIFFNVFLRITYSPVFLCEYRIISLQFVEFNFGSCRNNPLELEHNVSTMKKEGHHPALQKNKK